MRISDVDLRNDPTDRRTDGAAGDGLLQGCQCGCQISIHLHPAPRRGRLSHCAPSLDAIILCTGDDALLQKRGFHAVIDRRAAIADRRSRRGTLGDFRLERCRLRLILRGVDPEKDIARLNRGPDIRQIGKKAA